MGLQSAVATFSRTGKLAKLAWTARKALGTQPDAAARRALVAMLANARGVPLKVAQFLSSRTDDPHWLELAKGVEPQPWEVIAPVLEQQLGNPIDTVFREIDERGIAASLGQVHRGVLLDGSIVAVKVRYPDIEHAIDAELRLIGLMPGMGPIRRWGFALESYKSTFRSNMLRELDYIGEARRQTRFRQAVQIDHLVVPSVYETMSGDAVLVQSWERGDPLDVAQHWPTHDRTHIGRTLIRTLFHSLFVAGVVHGDPHLGNIAVRRTPGGKPEVVLFDYGCTVDVDRDARLALLKIIMACRRRADVDPFDCFVAMGFDGDKLDPLRPTLPALCDILFEPFCDDRPMIPAQWSLSKRINALLGDLRWWFRSAGPSDLFLLLRALAGLTNQLQMLKAHVPWWQELRQAVGSDVMQEADSYKPPNRYPADYERRGFNSVSECLRVRVTDGGQEVVSLAMPAQQVAELADLIPPDVLPRIEATGVDVATIARNACLSGLVPQDLFETTCGTRTYRVWLD